MLREGDHFEYGKILREANNVPRDAFFKWKVSMDGGSEESYAAADGKISETTPPFDVKKDIEAIRRGAVLYYAHCLGCHGEKADGRGPDMKQVLPKMNFRGYWKRFAIENFSKTPSKWYKKVSEGIIIQEATTESELVGMPAFDQIMAREQIWLAVGYLMGSETMVEGE